MLHNCLDNLQLKIDKTAGKILINCTTCKVSIDYGILPPICSNCDSIIDWEKTERGIPAIIQCMNDNGERRALCAHCAAEIEGGD